MYIATGYKILYLYRSSFNYGAIEYSNYTSGKSPRLNRQDNLQYRSGNYTSTVIIVEL